MFLPLLKKSFIENWDSPALSDNDEDFLNYKDLAKNIAEIHLIFETLGIQKGDRVAIYGRNSVNWAVTFFATLTYGATATTILSDFNPETVHNIVTHSESKILFSGKALYDGLDINKMLGLKSVVLLEDLSLAKSESAEKEKAYTNARIDFAKKYKENFSIDDMYFHTEHPEEMAILNYTSGTTSKPKGVMIPYRSIWSNTQCAIDTIPYIHKGVNIVSNLPMGHMYGLAFELILGISVGCRVHFLSRVPSPQYLLGTFKTYQPPLVCLVPLILEKIIQNMILPALQGKLPETQEEKKMVKEKLVQIFGGNLRQVCIAGAALSKESSELLTSIDFPYTVGYGMTECATLITFTDHKEFKINSCGKAVDRMEVKIDSKDPANIPGELLTKGMNVMLGYYKNEEATKEVLSEDGWLSTGDLAVMDDEGSCYIKGRSKTMILGSSGHNIYPEEIEELFNGLPHVVESLVVSNGNKLVALIYPDIEVFNLETIKENLTQFVEDIKASINKRLPSYSHISQIKLRFEEFEKTPKRSIRRFLYQEGETC